MAGAEVFLGVAGVGGVVIAVSGLVIALEYPTPTLRLEAKVFADGSTWEVVVRNVGRGPADRVRVWISDRATESERPTASPQLLPATDWVPVEFSDWLQDGEPNTWKRTMESRPVDDHPLPGFGSNLHVGNFPIVGKLLLSTRCSFGPEVRWPNDT